MQVTPINCNSTKFYGKCSEKIEPFVMQLRNNDIEKLLEETEFPDLTVIKESKLDNLQDQAKKLFLQLNDIMRKYFHENTVLMPNSEKEDGLLYLTNTLLGTSIVLVGEDANITHLIQNDNQYGIFSLEGLQNFIKDLLKKYPKGVCGAISAAQKELYTIALAKLTSDANNANESNLPVFIQRIKNIIKYKNECHIDDELPTKESLTNMVKKAAENNAIKAYNQVLADKYINMPLITPKEVK